MAMTRARYDPRMRGLLIAALVACSTPQPKDVPAKPKVAAGSVAVPAGSDAVPADAARPDATRAPQRVVGTLHPPSATAALYPTRVCIDGNELVFEHDCGCNDGLLCRVGAVANGAVAVTLTKDPSRPLMCDDCFPMVPGRCALPSLIGKGNSIAVAINGQAAFELSLDRDGKPIDGSCWTARP
jgi:hypothetical protein